MAKFGVLIYKSNQKKDGSFPVCLRITKDGKRKYIDLGLTANGMKKLPGLKRISV